MDFIDRAAIQLKAGNGGNGSAHFRREKFAPFGGPDGGDGGRGGSIYMEATPQMNTLVDFHYNQKFKAEHGEHGGGNRCHGKAGDELIIKVPTGTLIRNSNTNEIMGDLITEGQRIMIARGGKGGLGNTHFATPTNRAPKEAQLGEPGEEIQITMELKLLADVGLVGLPNAGKSTLLSVVTAAHPKIANYPFTTLVPNLGVVVLGNPRFMDSQSFVIADIPGLIEGAAEGIGLGHDFLRHIERTRLILHLIDGDNISQDPVEEFDTINRELIAYRAELAQLTQIAIFTKMDLASSRERWPDFERIMQERNIPVFAISAPTRQGLEDVINFTAEQLREIPIRPLPEVTAAGIAGSDEIILRPRDDSSFTITREEGVYVVHGRRVERFAAMTNTTNAEAMARLEKHLRGMGVFASLELEGVKPGDFVRFGPVELEWGEG